MTQLVTPTGGCKTRLRKVWCQRDNYITRVSRTTIITLGAPICPVCRQSMKEENR